MQRYTLPGWKESMLQKMSVLYKLISKFKAFLQGYNKFNFQIWKSKFQSCKGNLIDKNILKEKKKQSNGNTLSLGQLTPYRTVKRNNITLPQSSQVWKQKLTSQGLITVAHINNLEFPLLTSLLDHQFPLNLLK